MAKYIIEWSELNYYRVEIEAENEDIARDNAMRDSTSSDIVWNDCQLELCKEIPEGTYVVDVIVDPLTGQKEVSLQREDNNG